MRASSAGPTSAPDDPRETTTSVEAPRRPEARDGGFTPPERTVIDRALRDRVRAAIYRAWSEGQAAPSEAAPRDPVHAPMPTLDGGRVDPGYIRARIREDFLPMAQGCYEQYQRRAPGASGRVVMRFVVVGDTRVGGVVDEAELDAVDGGMGDGGTGDQEFSTCLRESMMAMAFRPPPESGRLSVTYPFAFRPDDGGT